MHEHHNSHRPHPEQVVLEIGADLGALVVYTEPDMRGVEIEISPAGADDRRQHKEVLYRPVGSRAVHAAVFDRLGEGSYTLWMAGAAVARNVAVAGGRISELDWHSAPAPAQQHAGHH